MLTKKLKMFPSSLALGKGRKGEKKKGPESPLVTAEARELISVQWLSCQNWQGIFVKSGFPSSVFKKTGGIKQPFFLAGNRNTNGTFNNRGTNGNFWTSSQYSDTNSWNRNLNSDNATVNRNNNNKANGFSVRCLKGWYLPFLLL